MFISMLVFVHMCLEAVGVLFSMGLFVRICICVLLLVFVFVFAMH